MGGVLEFELKGIGSCVVIKNNEAIAVDDKFSELTGYSCSEIEGISIEGILRLLRSNSLEDVSFDKPFESGYIFTKELEPRRIRVTRHELGDNSGQAYCFEEVPRSRLEDTFAYYYQLHKDNICGMAVYSVPDLTLLKANDKYLDYLEEPHNKLESCIGYKISDIFEDWNTREGKRYLDRVIKSGKSYKGDEFEVYRKDRGVSYWQYVITPITFEDSVKFVIIQINDVTEKVKAKNELEKVLKMQEDFFSFIAHEFRTPLTVMNSTIQLINHIYKDSIPEKVNCYIGKLRQSTLQQLRLVNNLLDITRADSGYLKVNLKNYNIVEVSRAITESVREFAQRKGIKLKFTSQIENKIIAVDDEKYERILLNLLSNAIKFTAHDKEVAVEVFSESNYTCISVRDQGVGIPKNKQEIIFERFGQVSSSLTRKSEGTGIGLCLTKLLVGAMGGRIEVASEMGQGSTFTIYLPDDTIREVENKTDNNLLDNRLVQSMDIEFSNIYM